MNSSVRSLHLLLAAAVAAGCSGSSTLSSLAISPPAASVAVGKTVSLAVSGKRSDGSTQPITGATWASSATGIATVDTAGTVTGIAAGIATITATSSGLTASAQVTVQSAALVSLSVAPATATIAIGGTRALTVTGTYDDSTTATLTASATFVSSAAAVASVSSAGLVTGVAAGSVTITVSYGGKTATSAITVSPGAPTLTSIAATPATVTLAIGGHQDIAVIGTYSDQSTANLTSSAAFASSATAVATVSSTGTITAVAAGSATITVTASGKTATVAVTVQPASATLVSIAAAPLSVSLQVGATQALAITGTYSDSSTATLTSSATFTSDTPAVATVSTAGVVTGVSGGTASIAVTAGGQGTSVPVTVATPTLVSIAATPKPASLAVAATAQLTVTGTYSAGPTQDVTASATFSSRDATIATVSSAGLVTAVMAGSTTVDVSVARGGTTAVTDAVDVTVVAADASAVFLAGRYGAGVQFLPFGGSTNDVTVDAATTLNATGHGSLKIVYPASGYTGGAFVDESGPRDLTGFDAVTFWAKSSAAMTLEKVGLGNNGGYSAHNGYEVETNGLALTTSWQQFTVPIPAPSKLTADDGLFHFADGSNHAPFIIWLADIQYQKLGAGVLGAPTPSWNKTTLSLANGLTYQIVPPDLTVNYSLASGPVQLNVPSTNYFTFASDAAAATVSATGLVTGANSSSAPAGANLTATLAGVTTSNRLAVTVSGGGTPTAPTTLPPTPAQAAGAGVISLYSSAPGGYAGTPSDKSGNVDTWLTSWSAGSGGGTFTISAGGQTASPRKYVMGSSTNYVGIEFLGKTAGAITGVNEIDISGMTTFHIDVWTPDDDSNFQVKLVDAGADGKLDGQDTFGLVTLTGGSTPPLATGKWLSYDIPLSNGFGASNWVSPPTNLKHLGQMVLVAPNGGTVYVDNIYFYSTGAGGGGATVPPAAAPTPAVATANVISFYSAAYAGTAADFGARVDSYDASCFGPPGTTLVDYTIAGTAHVVKQYGIPANSFAIIELIGDSGGTPTPPDSPICHGGTQTGANLTDVSGMTTLHFDVWSPGGSGNFQVHLVNADGTHTIAGPGAATGASGGSNFASGANTVGKAAWVSFEIPLSTLGPPGAPAGLTSLGLIKFFTTDGGTFFVDNLYFHN